MEMPAQNAMLNSVNVFALMDRLDNDGKFIGDQIITALESGSRYWMNGLFNVSAPLDENGADHEPGPWYANPKIWEKNFQCEALTYEGQRVIFNKAGALHGLLLMAKETPWHWNDLLAENSDATTADVFMQFALFGAVVYG